MLDYRYFVNVGAVENYSDKNRQIKALCRTLNVASLSVLERTDLLTACKTSIGKVSVKNVINANAWIQLGKMIARQIECNPYSQDNLLNSIPKLRALTRENLAIAFPKIQKIFLESGIALIALPYMKNSGLNGAVQWLNNNKAMLLINDRGKDVSNFWFTLFHEINHILQKRTTFVYLTSEDKKSAILSLGRNDDIVIGRLKHDALLDWKTFTKNRPRYKINYSKISNE